MTRREWLQALAVAGAVGAVGGRASAAGAQDAPKPTGPFSLPPLPYAVDALEPYIDAQTMQIHHDKHHQAYVDNLNAAIAKHAELATKPLDQLLKGLDAVPEDVRTAIRNHGGGHANHSLFWTSLKKGGGTLGGELAKAVTTTFGDAAKMQEQLTGAATKVFGSGWAWLAADKAGALVITSTPNQDTVLATGHTPLVGIDVWEHAYYLKYQNRRAEYLKAILNVIDWDAVSARYAGALKK
jgi:Fe-Mn family superoxide dismutase